MSDGAFMARGTGDASAIQLRAQQAINFRVAKLIPDSEKQGLQRTLQFERPQHQFELGSLLKGGVLVSQNTDIEYDDVDALVTSAIEALQQVMDEDFKEANASVVDFGFPREIWVHANSESAMLCMTVWFRFTNDICPHSAQMMSESEEVLKATFYRMNNEVWGSAFQAIYIECKHGGEKWSPHDCTKASVRKEMQRVFQRNGAAALYEAGATDLVNIG